MNPDQQPNPQPSPTSILEDRVATLTATVDQLQAEHDRDSFALTFLLLAAIALAGCILIEHRQLAKLAREIAT